MFLSLNSMHLSYIGNSNLESTFISVLIAMQILLLIYKNIC